MTLSPPYTIAQLQALMESTHDSAYLGEIFVEMKKLRLRHRTQHEADSTIVRWPRNNTTLPPPPAAIRGTKVKYTYVHPLGPL